ncbi:MAG: hypothetical protein M9894_27985 [Planctomycetes bacterium]|nr:hypothetical protein [Planctomycetota bacterium]
MRPHLLAALLLLLGSPGCVTILLSMEIESAARGRSEPSREVTPALVVEEVGEPPHFYCIDATYPAGLRVRYDVRPDLAGWRLQTPGTTTSVRAHDPDHASGIRLVPKQDFDFTQGVLDVRGRAGHVTLELPDHDEDRRRPAPSSQQGRQVLLALLYPLAIALDAVTWPLQLVLLALVNPTSLP